MRAALTLFILILLAACSRQSANVSFGNGVVQAVNCSDPTSYDVRVATGGTPGVDVTSRGTLWQPVEVPSRSDVPGFTLNWAKKTERGFDISIEFGGRIYFGKRLIFECRQDELYLTSVDVESFDKSNLSKKKHKLVDIKPPVPLARFRLIDQTTDASNAGLYP